MEAIPLGICHVERKGQLKVAVQLFTPDPHHGIRSLFCSGLDCLERRLQDSLVLWIGSRGFPLLCLENSSVLDELRGNGSDLRLSQRGFSLPLSDSEMGSGQGVPWWLRIRELFPGAQ